MKLEFKHYSKLDKNEFHDLIQLRIAVFIVEQNCPYMELDGLDKDAYHLLLKDEETGLMIGTLRILKPGVVYSELAIGRVVTHADYRDQKLGYAMMEATMHFIKHGLKLNTVRLSAQSHLTHFYGKYNFVKTGKDYLEDDIPHSEMLFVEKINPSQFSEN